VTTIDRTVDARGLNCPMPILRARKALGEVPVGGVLEVLASDAGAPADFEAFAKTTGHVLLSCDAMDGVFRILLQRSA